MDELTYCRTVVDLAGSHLMRFGEGKVTENRNVGDAIGKRCGGFPLLWIATSDECSLDMDNIAASVRRFGLAEVVEIQSERIVAIDDVESIRVVIADEHDLSCDREVMIREIPQGGMVETVVDRGIGFRIRPRKGGCKKQKEEEEGLHSSYFIKMHARVPITQVGNW